MTNHPIPPAQLWIGKPEILIDHVHEFLKTALCPYDSCSVCIHCRNIRQQQHHAIVWIHPEKSYTVEDLATVFTTMAFALNDDQRLFFILHKADFLTATCANSLLKSLEEPPPGYHFILLAERPDQILPTIRSRCTIHSYYDDVPLAHHTSFIAFFCSTRPVNPLAFVQELDQSTPTEQETIDLLDHIFAFWLTVHQQATGKADHIHIQQSAHMIALLHKHILMPPMPGSSKIFWRNLFLQMHATC